MNNRGQTVIGLVLSAVIIGIVALLSTGALNSFFKKDSELATILESQTQVNELYVQLLKVIRMASTCAPLSSPSALRCNVDLGIPRSGSDTAVSFTFDPASKSVTLLRGAKEIKYANIAGLIFCDDAAMAASCPILPATINTVHTANLTTGAAATRTLPGRLVRFSIQGVGPDGLAAKLQGAAWVRNPTGIANIYFAWGSR